MAGNHGAIAVDLYNARNVPSRPGTPGVKPSPTIKPASLPAKEADSTFDFSVPTFRPSLANFGRKISQMRDEFMADFEADYNGVGPSPPAAAGSSASSTGTRRSLDTNRPSSSASKSFAPVEEVPGMGEEPVMCPFCEKPLPPALFTSHSHANDKPKRGTGAVGLQRSATVTGSNLRPIPTRSVTAGTPAATSASQASKATPSASSAPQAKLLDPLPVDSPQQSDQPVVTISADAAKATPEALGAELDAADKANSAAATSTISEQDLKRWYEKAGLAAPAVKVPEPVIPKLPPPGSSAPSGIAQSKPNADTDMKRPAPERTASGSRFGFFKKGSTKDVKEDDSESDDDAGQAGYSKLLGAGSDTEDEDESAQGRKGGRQKGEEESVSAGEDGQEVIHDEPADTAPAALEEEAQGVKEDSAQESKPQETETAVSPDDLKAVLREVLDKLGQVSKSHDTLLTSQGSLLTSLKIARSNLVMAEANTEMLEAQLKTAKSPGQSGSPRSAIASSTSPRTPAAGATRPGGTNLDPPHTATGAPARHSEESRQRPMSLQIPSSGSAAQAPSSAKEGTGWGGFWNGGKKKLPSGLNMPSPITGMSSITSPSIERISMEHGAAGAGGDRALVRSSSMAALPTSPPQATSQLPSSGGSGVINNPSSASFYKEMERLRSSYSESQTKIKAMTAELEELKKGKVEMEAELEGLSQALFEEANKMVADERRKVSELEESLREIQEEKDALKETIKVLGGKDEVKFVTPSAPTTPSRSDRASNKGTPGRDRSDTVNTSTTGGLTSPPLDDFQPRDLDKHYAALRKSIHHGSDKIGDVKKFASSDSGRSGNDSKAVDSVIREDEESEDDKEEDEPVVFSTKRQSIPPVAPPTDPNPWANPSPFDAATTATHKKDPSTGSDLDEMDRLMKELKQEMKE